MSDSFTLSGNIVDVVGQTVFPGTLSVEAGKIATITPTPGVTYPTTYSPGLVDAHVHIESSMLAPSEFARAATQHGTVATVSDPHEIANVLGIEGIEWMIENGHRSPFKFYFGAPSCVPATPFETAGAQFGPEDIQYLLSKPEIKYLAEVMNFPAVVAREPKMMAIIQVAQALGKRIDGHSPGLLDEPLEQYVRAGIETDHECTTLLEAQQRIQLGMKVAIREGSAAKNFEALWPIIHASPDAVFLCSDDKHPDDLVIGHINALLRRLVDKGIDPLTAIQLATLNPVRHYGLEVGLLQPGDPADIVEWNDLKTFEAQRTWIDGQLVATRQQPQLPSITVTPINRFSTQPQTVDAFRLSVAAGSRAHVISALDGQLFTHKEQHTFAETLTNFESDTANNILKIAVVNRYTFAPPAIGLVTNFGLRRGAMASSVAHDSHNIVAVGTHDVFLCAAVNAVIAAQGGLCAVNDDTTLVLPLPIAGLMSERDAWQVATEFKALTRMVQDNGCALTSPFMTLSFMALLVIPDLKMSDRGLFDVHAFNYMDLLSNGSSQNARKTK